MKLWKCLAIYIILLLHNVIVDTADKPEDYLKMSEFAVVRQDPLSRLVDEDISTHDNWITIEDQQYKIFHKRRTWNDARSKCIEMNADLAVFPTVQVAQNLTKFLLTGRPTIEEAWINVSAHKNNYNVASNILNADVDGMMNNEKLCLLLDRHLKKTSNFIVSMCRKLRSYICSKSKTRKIQKRSVDVGKKEVLDIIIDTYGYRVYYKPQKWTKANAQCNTFKELYNGKLAEIRTPAIMRHLVYVMGQNTTVIDHLWLGGKYKNHQWRWISDNEKIDIDKIDGWVYNKSYSHDIEKLYTCLNMDLRFHSETIVYGTECNYPHQFICEIPLDKLNQLRESEIQKLEDKIPMANLTHIFQQTIIEVS